MFKKLIQWAQGRHTLFAVFFALFGSVLQWFHRLDMNYIALIGAVQAFVFAHSCKEDYFANKQDSQDPQNPDPQEPAK